MGSKHNRKLRSKGYRVEVDPLPRWQQDHTKKDQPRRKHGQSNQNSSKISPSPKDKKQMAADYKEIRKLTSKIRSKKKILDDSFQSSKKKARSKKLLKKYQHRKQELKDRYGLL